MSHYYQDQIKSMASLVDYRIQANMLKVEHPNEQPNVFKQNEMDTCNIDGGPWFDQYEIDKRENTSDCGPKV
jgi:hypothetical protein